MHKRGLAPIVITTLIIILALGSVAIIYQSTKPFLEQSIAKKNANSCLTLALIPASCIYDDEFVSLRTERKQGSGELTKVRFIIETDTGSDLVDAPGERFAQLETHTIQIPRSQLNGVPTKFDVAPIIGAIVCQETGVPITCQAGDPPAPNIDLHACNDGEDNDQDGWTDQEDPGCIQTAGQTEENVPTAYECSDDRDNDGDRLKDGFDRLDCENWQDPEEGEDMSLPACNDGEDNDGDGLIDYPIDDGCVDTLSTETAQVHTKDNLYAYAWDGQAHQSFVWRAPMIATYHEDDWRTNNSDIIAQKLQAMPEGHRALIDWDLLGANQPKGIGGDDGEGADPVLFNNPGDRCKDSSGQRTVYPCPWLDAGLVLGKQRYNTFLNDYTSNPQRPRIDIMILDMEMGFGVWGICTTPGSNPDDRCVARFNAIWNDPRSTTTGLKAELEREIGPLTDFSRLYRLEGGAERGGYLVWEEIMRRTIVRYKEQASYDVVKTKYPSIKMSNYDDSYYSREHSFPTRFGHNMSFYGSGGHLGTHQAGHFYMEPFSILCTNQEGELYYYWDPLCPAGSARYENTAFNGMRYSLNSFRTSRIASDVPHIPWISHKPYEDNLARDSDIYQEHIMHLILNGADDLVLWNPHKSGATDATDKLVEDILNETNLLVGFQGLTPLTNKKIENWNDDYYLSGAKAGGRNIWRFTPESMGTTTLTESEENVIIRTGAHTITFPEGVVYRPRFTSRTSAGYWVVQPENTAAPTVQP